MFDVTATPIKSSKLVLYFSFDITITSLTFVPVVFQNGQGTSTRSRWDTIDLFLQVFVPDIVFLVAPDLL